MATLSWLLYDLADTVYSMNVVSLYFPVWVVNELSQPDWVVSIANSISMIFVAAIMPVLGDWSDYREKKLFPLMLSTGMCILCTALIGLSGSGIQNLSVLVPFITVLFIVANFSYQGSLVFYNALMPVVSTERTLGRVSGYGVAFGYLGTIIGLIVANIFVEAKVFNWQIPWLTAGGTTAAFVPTALVFLLFAAPLFIFVREPKYGVTVTPHWSIRSSYRKIWNNVKNTRQYPGLLRFLVAKFFYEDSIQTIIIFMGVYTQAVMGFSRSEVNQFFMIVTPAAIVGSAFCGIMVDHYGPKKTLSGVILLWIMALILVILTNNRAFFWFMGGLVGALMGSVWTSARPLLITLVPKSMLGEFFGLYALSGKMAAILGPLIWSAVTLSLRNYGEILKYKAAIGALAILMLVGWIVLYRVPDFHRKDVNI